MNSVAPQICIRPTSKSDIYKTFLKYSAQIQNQVFILLVINVTIKM